MCTHPSLKARKVMYVDESGSTEGGGNFCMHMVSWCEGQKAVGARDGGSRTSMSCGRGKDWAKCERHVGEAERAASLVT